MRLVVVEHVPQHAEHRDRDRLAEVQRVGGAGGDGFRIMHVCVDVVGDPSGVLVSRARACASTRGSLST